MTEARVEAVERALSILEAFAQDRQAMTLTALAAETGLYKSTVLRLAASLERYGYLKREADLTFRLGPALWRLGAIYRKSFDLGDRVRPYLRRLVEGTGETASFYVLDQNERLCLCRENSPDAIRHHLEEGARLTLQFGAAGHVLSAFGRGSSAARARLLPGGGCVSVGERNPHVAAVAQPVFDLAGRFQGALSVSGPKARFDEGARAAALVLLTAMAAEIASDRS